MSCVVRAVIKVLAPSLLNVAPPAGLTSDQSIVRLVALSGTTSASNSTSCPTIICDGRKFIISLTGIKVISNPFGLMVSVFWVAVLHLLHHHVFSLTQMVNVGRWARQNEPLHQSLLPDRRRARSEYAMFLD